jgi:hypothetical protein
MREIRWLFVFSRLEVEVADGFKRDVALFGNYSHHARASRLRSSVKLECHDMNAGMKMCVGRADANPSPQ